MMLNKRIFGAAFERNLRRAGGNPSQALQDQWVAHHDETANKTLVVKTDSWYMGTNVAGKPRRLLSYIGGVGTYRQKCDEVAASGYRGFTFA